MFYIRVPRGKVPLHILEKCVFSRLEYLQLLYQAKAFEFNGNFEYLLENSVYDKVGHFSLRLLSSVSEDLKNYWIIRETLLFQSRLNHVLPRQLYRLLRSIIRELRLLGDKEKLINRTLIDICNFFSSPTVFKHLISKNHNDECTYFQSKVRYELVPDLIRGRKVDLTAGYAIVYCSKWREILSALFYTYMTKELACMKSRAQHSINQDIRLDYLYQKIHCQVFKKNSGYGCITTDNIDTEMKKFPLCMQHLHMQLRSTHRLSHYARLYYSLFLKDGGMQLEDAINYWKEEYSKPHACTSACSHNWQSSERKFVYSIRHLYGLEGSRKNYNSPNCEFMCINVSGPMYEGGCPFKNFDANALKNLLNLSLQDNQIAELLNTISPQNPRGACTEFFKLLKQNSTDNIVINSPLQYYLTMIN
ncbi:DNA primase large subunit [Calliopsis andreniformis]|uniref:DNA primase large subunit n=1 Tax=Calliopsis andreniformis TaxID=337506 RepID=UPI003FCC91EF